MNRKIKFALVGCGQIGRKHAMIINEYPGTELVAIVDTNADVTVHALYPNGVPFFHSLEELFESLQGGTDIDVLSIATPNGLHIAHALTGIKNNCHVLIEKPMGLSKSDCEEVVHTALQYRKEVFVVKQNRYSPPSKWMKEIINGNLLGKLELVQINCYWNRDDQYYKPGGWKGTKEMDGGTLFTQFSHFIDIMYWTFGDITNISARFNNYTHQHSIQFEDTGIVQFDFVKGGIGCLNYSTAIWNKNMESSITVIGEKGSFKIGGQYMNEIEYCHIENYEVPQLPPTNPPNDYGPFKGSAANHHYVIENVVNTLNGNDQITANGLEGMKVVDIIERIYQQKQNNN